MKMNAFRFNPARLLKAFASNRRSWTFVGPITARWLDLLLKFAKIFVRLSIESPRTNACMPEIFAL
uniref:DDE_Tnp_1_7 domain-containing protein n=1 Tax=Mesocestoides corti TaxID=53468 RepID=A0A5K3FZC8_MESCO